MGIPAGAAASFLARSNQPGSPVHLREPGTAPAAHVAGRRRPAARHLAEAEPDGIAGIALAPPRRSGRGAAAIARSTYQRGKPKRDRRDPQGASQRVRLACEAGNVAGSIALPLLPASVLPADKLADCDDQFVDALIGLLVHLVHASARLANLLVRLAHTPIRFFKLFGNLIEAFAGRHRQFGDDFFQPVYALSNGSCWHGGIVSRACGPDGEQSAKNSAKN